MRSVIAKMIQRQKKFASAEKKIALRRIVRKQAVVIADTLTNMSSSEKKFYLHLYPIMFLMNFLVFVLFLFCGWVLHWDGGIFLNPFGLALFISVLPILAIADLFTPESVLHGGAAIPFLVFVLVWLFVVNPLIYSTIIYGVYRFVRMLRARYGR